MQFSNLVQSYDDKFNNYKGKSTMQIPFYMVWRDNCTGPTKHHATFEAARDEVLRLNEKHPNSTWHILECVATYRPQTPPMAWEAANGYEPQIYRDAMPGEKIEATT